MERLFSRSPVAVYERSVSEDSKPYELELILIKIRSERKMPNGDIVPQHEAYPSAPDWGKFAWSIPIRYKDKVLALAENLSSILEGRATVVRNALHEFWFEALSRAKMIEVPDPARAAVCPARASAFHGWLERASKALAGARSAKSPSQANQGRVGLS